MAETIAPPPSREPTEAMRLRADELYELWRIRNKIDWCNAAARALAEQDTAARRAGLELAAKWHEARAAIHARDAIWIGPNRERYEGARLAGVKMSPINGPAFAYDRETADATTIRALSVTPPEAASEKENERG